MAKPKANFDLVRKIGLDLPGVEESTSWGQPALKVGGKMFACLPSHASAEPGSLVVLIDFARREELLAEAPETYYIKPHYQNYPSVLVRLDRIDPEALRGLLAGALQFVRSKNRAVAARKRRLP
jgi:hypothetical protein